MTSAKNTPRPVKTAQYDPNISLADNWDISDPLNFGWFGYASIDFVEQYRDAGPAGPQRSAYLQAMMQMEVQQKIGAGAAIAIGIRLPTGTDLAPEVLPSLIFKSKSVVIDWNEGLVTALGQSFGDVRLCVSARAEAPVHHADSTASQTKRGRRSFGVELENAFAVLEATESHFVDWAQQAQIDALHYKVAELYPGLFPKTGPGRSTLARFLKRRREAIS